MERQNDLTQGSVTKQLLRYALPLVASSLMQSLYSIADMIAAGHFIGSAGQSAITNSSQVINLMTQIAIGITVGGNVLISSLYGQQKDSERKKASGTLFSLSALLGALFFLGIFLSAKVAVSLLGAPAPTESELYLRICSVGMVPVFLYNSVSTSMRAVGNSRQPMLCVAVGVSANIVLDILFMALGFGVAGAAAATVISQFISFFTVLAFALPQRKFLGLSRACLKISGAKAAQIFRLGIPISLQQAIAALSWLCVTFIINRYGVDVSAGNGISAKIKDFCQLVTIAVSNGAATMIAQCLGAGMYDRAKKIMYTAMKVTLSYAIAVIAVVELAAPHLVLLFTESPQTAAAAVENLRIEILGQIFYAIFLVYHSLAIGAGHTYYATFSSFVNCIAARVVLASVFNRFFGITGVYWALMLATSTSVILGFFYVRSGIWEKAARKNNDC